MTYEEMEFKAQINQRFDDIECNQRHIARALKLRIRCAGVPQGMQDELDEAIEGLDEVGAER